MQSRTTSDAHTPDTSTPLITLFSAKAGCAISPNRLLPPKLSFFTPLLLVRRSKGSDAKKSLARNGRSLGPFHVEAGSSILITGIERQRRNHGPGTGW